MRIAEALKGSCAETAELMSAQAEDELHGIRRWRVARHLAACARCQAIFRTLLGTIDALRALGRDEPEPKPEMADAVVHRIGAGP